MHARPTTPVSAAPPPHTEHQSPYEPPSSGAATGTLGTAWAEPATTPEPPRLRLESVERPTSTSEKPRRPSRPLEGTLQFLQGRFEVLEGREIGQEIRFVRQPGSAETEVTFGRQDGTPDRHIQLDEPSVSRLHAQMRLD